MQSTVVKKVVSDTDKKILLDWFNKKDKYLDVRPDASMKIVKDTDKGVPVNTLKKILDQTIPGKYLVQGYYFIKANFGWKIHADSDKGQKNLHKVAIIPLELNGPSSTMFFANHWHGPSAKFAKKKIPQFEYVLDINGKEKYIKDLRKFRSSDKKLMATVKDLIKKRKNIDGRQYDYSKITGITNKPFDKKIHKKYASHIPYEDFHGLTLEKIIKWNLGDAICFDRTQLHCGTNTHKEKIYITVFTNKQ